VNFITRASKAHTTKEYHEICQFLLKCFTAADNDFDGKVGLEDFDAMVEVAASMRRRFGFATIVAELFKTPDERINARRTLFASIDRLQWLHLLRQVSV